MTQPVAIAPPPVQRPWGGERMPLVALDGLACATLGVVGAAAGHLLDPFGFLPAWTHLALAVPFALIGPFGAGVERGRMSAVVALVVSLGAAIGAVLGGWLLDGLELASPVLLGRGAVALLGGPLLAFVGPSFHREEEAWRAEARLHPPEATPAFALRIARLRLPLALRVILAPVALALAPVGIAGLILIRCYKLAMSRLLPPQCRFEPSCSRYGFEAIARHGPVKGFLLTGFRLARCQPFCRSGHDPVPDDGSERG